MTRRALPVDTPGRRAFIGGPACLAGPFGSGHSRTNDHHVSTSAISSQGPGKITWRPSDDTHRHTGE